MPSSFHAHTVLAPERLQLAVERIQPLHVVGAAD
jgi:hypothetical protein